MAERSRIQGWHPEAEFRRLIEQVADYINTPTTERKLLMALTAEVQALVDAVAANTSASKSIEAALKVESDQIAALTTQVADLEAKLAAGGTISAEDLKAVVDSTTQLAETNAGLQAAAPAGVTRP